MTNLPMGPALYSKYENPFNPNNSKQHFDPNSKRKKKIRDFDYII
jgi:hypothetical protein